MIIYEYAEGKKDERKEDKEVIIKNLLLLFVISIAVVYDIKTWKIPNFLILIGVMTGFFMSILSDGFLIGMKNSLIGVITPIGILFILFLLRFMGAGDIKLFSVAGAFAGISILQILLYAFISGGIISFFYIVERILSATINHRKLSNEFAKDISGADGKNQYKNRIHFSIAVLTGVLYYMVTGT